MKCVICHTRHTGWLGMGPCKNGHTMQEEIAYANARVKCEETCVRMSCAMGDKCSRLDDDERTPA